MKDKRRLRLVRLVDALKRGLCVSTTAFARRLDELDATERLPLSASAKTVSRDIQYLRDTWKAPLEYDATAHGYYLTDRSWRLPHLYLLGDDLFPSIALSVTVARPVWSMNAGWISILNSMRLRILPGLGVLLAGIVYTPFRVRY